MRETVSMHACSNVQVVVVRVRVRVRVQCKKGLWC
jgi:hypothetical protein